MTFVYVLSNSSIVGNPVKIGIADDINQRLSTLNTSLPEKFGVAFALAHADRDEARATEKLLHKIFGKHRAENGEFFFVEEDIVVALMETWGENSWVSDCEEEPSEDYLSVAPRFRFSMVGLQKGDTIVNRRNGEKAKVASDETIIFRNQETSLSESGRIIKGEMGLSDANTPRGTDEWLYNGERLVDLR